MGNTFIYVIISFLKLQLSTAWHEPQLNAPYYPIQKYVFDGLDSEYLPESVKKEENDCPGFFLDCIANREDLHPLCAVYRGNEHSWYNFHDPCQLDYLNCVVRTPPYYYREKDVYAKHHDNFYFAIGDDKFCDAWVRAGTYEDAVNDLIRRMARSHQNNQINNIQIDTNKTKANEGFKVMTDSPSKRLTEKLPVDTKDPKKKSTTIKMSEMVATEGSTGVLSQSFPHDVSVDKILGKILEFKDVDIYSGEDMYFRRAAVASKDRISKKKINGSLLDRLRGIKGWEIANVAKS